MGFVTHVNVLAMLALNSSPDGKPVQLALTMYSRYAQHKVLRSDGAAMVDAAHAGLSLLHTL